MATPLWGEWRSRPAVVGLAVAALASACAAPQPVRRPGTEPSLRVALAVGVPEVRVGGNGVVVSPEGWADLRLEDDEEIIVVPVDRGVGMRAQATGRAFQQIRLESTNRTRFVRVNGRPYRGRVEVYAREGVLYAVNELRVEAYLLGVVSREMGSRTRDERAALEAQAIVSRTYALRNRGRFRGEGYDLRAGVSDQAYGGVAAETPLGTAAVRSTVGMVVTYGGDLISPFFHSTCGRSTATPEEAFRTVRPTAYLTPVSDRRPGGGYYCDTSPRFAWEVEWDGRELRDILRRTLPSVLGVDAAQADRVRGARVHRTGRSARATEVRIAVGDAEIPVFGPDIRRVFETPSGQALGSTAIDLTTAVRGGELERLTVSGSGWGHGVGMCQWGAIGRARAGQDTRTIVTTYFPGGRIAGWY